MTRKRFLLIVVLAVLSCTAAWSADGDTFTATTEEGVTMKFVVISEDDKTCKAGTSFSSNAVDRSTSGTVTVPSEVNGYTVVRISDRAFFSCTKITAINLPATITRIDAYAFAYTHIGSMEIPEGVTHIAEHTFENCFQLESVHLPATLQEIGTGAFTLCKSLASVTLPTGVTRIANAAFSGCESLTSINIPDGITGIESATFSGCKSLETITLPASVTAIGSSAFESCGLKEMLIPQTVKTLGNMVFANCANLERVSIPSSVETIGSKPFDGCTALKHLTIDQPTISTWFQDNTSLETVVLGSNVTAIGEKAFYGCTALQDIGLTEQVTSIGSNAFYNCKALKSIGVLNTPTVSTWFKGNTALESVVLGSGVTAIDASAFNGCKGLKQVVLPDGLESIGSSAFQYCAVLESVTLPASLSSIGTWAFQYCTDLRRVRSLIEMPFAVSAFTWTNAVLIVPQGKKADYKSATGWKDAIVFEEGETVYDKTYTDAQGVKYTLNQNGDNLYYSATGHTTDLPTEVTIAADIDGCPVTAVANSTFKDCTLLTKATLPASLTSINFGAFAGCISLAEIVSQVEDPSKTSVTMVKEVYDRAILRVPAGTKAAYLNSNWKSFIIYEQGETVVSHERSVTDEQGVQYTLGQTVEAFYYAVSGHTAALAERVTIPEVLNGLAVTTINSSSFKDCTGLKWISIPASVVSISKSYNFTDCSLTLVLNQKTVSGWGEASYIHEVELGSNVDSLANEAFRSCKNLTKVTFSEGLKGIGSYVFQQCTALEAISLPQSLRTIGANAFYGCTALQAIDLKEGISTIGGYAFSGCKSLYISELPASVTSIGDAPFQGCTIETVTIGSNLKTVTLGGRSFYGCTITNTNIHVKDFTTWFYGLTSIKHVYVGSEVETYSNGLTGCTGVETIEVDAANTVLDSRDGCNALVLTATNQLLRGCNTTVIPETVTSIAASAFAGCKELAEVTLPAGVTSIGKKAFNGCTGLQHVTSYIKKPFAIRGVFDSSTLESATLTIPFGTTYYYQKASGWGFQTIEEMEGSGDEATFIEFADAAMKRACVNKWDKNKDGEISLEEAKLVPTVNFSGDTSIGSFDELKYFTNITAIEASAFRNCTNLTAITLPEGVTSIGQMAFEGCASLTAITLPESVAAIGQYVFRNCTALTSAHLPDNCTSIPRHLFYGCTSLTDFTLPGGVTSIGQYAFYNCTALTGIALSEGLQEIGECAFNGSGLTEMTLPSTLTSIGDYALAGSTIHCRLTTPISVGTLMRNAQDVLLYVPQGCLDAFSKATGWRDFMILEEGYGSIDWADGQVTVDVDEPGGLRLALIELDDEEILRLKIRGSLNSSDIKYLVDGLGKIANLESLDLSDVTLVYDGGCYRESTFSGIGDTGFEGRYTYYYLTDYEKTETNYVMGLSPKYYYYYYGPHLAGAFEGKPYRHVVMPQSVTEAATDVFANCQNLMKVEYPGGMGDVGESAFYKCERLTSVSLERTDTVGSQAFYGCKMLMTVEHLDHVKALGYGAFDGCQRLTADVLSLSQVDSIPANAFKGCKSLGHIQLSDRLHTIGDGAFSGCTALQTVDYNAEALRHVNYTCFENTPWMKALPVENGIMYMGAVALSYDTNSGVTAAAGATLAFREGTAGIADRFIGSVSNASNVSKLSLPATLRRIGERAFASNKLTTLTLPDGLEEIGQYVFNNSSQLTKVTLPVGLKSVGQYAFASSPQLAIVNYNAINADGASIFSSCTSMEKVNVGAQVLRLPESIFSGCKDLTVVKFAERADDLPFSLGNAVFSGCSQLASITLPAATDVIGREAFQGCTALSSFSLPQRLTVIGDYAFSNCSAIPAFELPESLDSIGASAFNACYGLTEMTIPAGVSRLGDGFLTDCYNLTHLVSHIREPQALNDIISMGNGVIQNVYGYYYNWDLYRDIHYDEVTLTVPDGCKPLYRNTNGWKKFNNIEELSGGDVTATNKLYVSGTTVAPGGTTQLAVGLQNTVGDFTAYQFDLIVPLGFTLATKANGSYDVTLGDRYEDGTHTVTVEKLPDHQYTEVNMYRFVCVSPQNAPISGTDGILLTATLHAHNNYDEGDYGATIENVVFTQTGGTESALDRVVFDLTVARTADVLLGDANGDGTVNVSDAVSVINHILMQPDDQFRQEAADVNRDGVINVSDVVEIVAIIMNTK